MRWCGTLGRLVFGDAWVFVFVCRPWRGSGAACVRLVAGCPLCEKACSYNAPYAIGDYHRVDTAEIYHKGLHETVAPAAICMDD